jgi:hypothetical protein
MAERFVLLHGSWHGGWAWEPTAWCLRELGHEAYAPTYPGHQPGASRAGVRHQDYVRSVVDFIEGRDLRDVVPRPVPSTRSCPHGWARSSSWRWAAATR